MADRVDVIVVGAGVVGLAVGRALAQSGREIVVLDRHDRIGQETTSRNSGVVHAGMYYPTGSLKAKLCVRGRDLLYQYCDERGIAYRRTGKIIVAQSEQIDALHALQKKGAANGVRDLQLLSNTEIHEMEPALRCAAGLYSPSTGIIDVHEYITSLWADLEAGGGVVAFNSRLVHASAAADGFVATVESGASVTRLSCRWLINAAGLHAAQLLRQIDGYPASRYRTAHFTKGNYFAFGGRSPFRHLVYPIPGEGGLGIHATLDLGGALRFGPDVEWVEKLDYAVDPKRADAFYGVIRQYWPGIPDGTLQPAYAGIRPKLDGANAAAADFVIEDEAAHSTPGLINLLGIESPGLTCSLAIAEYVLGRLSASDGLPGAASRRS